MTSIPYRLSFLPLSYLMLQGLIVVGVDTGGSDRHDSTFCHLLVEIQLSCLKAIESAYRGLLKMCE